MRKWTSLRMLVWPLPLLALSLLGSWGEHQWGERWAEADQNPAPASVGLWNYSTFTLSTTTSWDILPRNTGRAGLIIQNNGTVSVVVKPGSAPGSATDGIVLIAGQILQINPVPVDAWYGESASSTAKVVLIEFAK